MKIFRKICDTLSEICCVLSAVACVIMMILVTVDTTGRFLFSHPVTGSYEVCQYLLCIILFGGYAYCQEKHGFLHVTMFIRKFPWRICCAAWGLVSLFAIVVVGMLAYQCYRQSMYDLSVSAISTLLKIPKSPFELFACIALAIMLLDLLCDFFSAIVGIFNKEHADELIREWV